MTSAETTATRKRSRWRTVALRTLLVSFILLIGFSLWLAIAGNPERQFHIDEKTTVLTEPITSKGLVDYAEALKQRHREEVRPEENACRLIIQAVGPWIFDGDQWAALAYEELEMTPLPPTGNYRVTLQEIVEEIAHENRMPFVSDVHLELVLRSIDCSQVPWSADEFPDLARWTAANEKPLETIREASLLPRYRHPVLVSLGGGLLELMLPIAQELREISRLLAVRAMQRVHEGDLAGAWDDILTIHRLSHLHAQGDTVVEYLGALAMARVANDAMQPLLSSLEMSPELLAQIERDWQALPPWPELSRIIDTNERHLMLDVVQRTARFGPEYLTSVGGDVAFSGDPGDNRGDPVNWMTTRVINTMVDWDSMMVDANRWYDRLTAAVAEPDPALRAALFEEFDDDIDQLGADTRTARFPSTHNVGSTLMTSVLPPLIRLHKVINDRDARIGLVNTALAIEQYRAAQGQLPAALNDLVPDFVPAVPLDPHSPGDELLYLRQGDDGYVLYSVGQGYDDGGLTENKDITFRVRMPTPEWLLPPARITDPGAEQVQ